MLKFIWKDDERVGYYQCQLIDDTGKLEDILFYDYSNPFHIENDKRNRFTRKYAYEIHYCLGYSMTKGIDKTEDENEFGYVGKPKHSIDDVKHWCENYLAAQIINDYYNTQNRFVLLKNRAEELLKLGYSDVLED